METEEENQDAGGQDADALKRVHVSVAGTAGIEQIEDLQIGEGLEKNDVHEALVSQVPKLDTINVAVLIDICLVNEKRVFNVENKLLVNE